MSGDSKEQRVESLEEGGGVQGGEEEGGAGGDRMKFNWTLFLQEYGQHLIFHFADLFGDAMQWASLKTDPAEAEIAQTQVAGLSLTVVDAALIAFVINVVISIGSLVFDVFAHMETNSIEHKYTREDHQYREGKLKAQRRNSLIRLPLAVVEDVPSLLVSSFVLSLKGHDINGIFFYNLVITSFSLSAHALSSITSAWGAHIDLQNTRVSQESTDESRHDYAMYSLLEEENGRERGRKQPDEGVRVKQRRGCVGGVLWLLQMLILCKTETLDLAQDYLSYQSVIADSEMAEKPLLFFLSAGLLGKVVLCMAVYGFVALCTTHGN